MTAPVMKIKGLLIDPERRTITEVEIPVDEDGSSLDGMYRALDCSTVDCGRGGLFGLPGRPADDVWFDDEGLYSDKHDGFVLPGWVPIIGRGLILGFDADGNSVDHTLSGDDVEALTRTIRWWRRRD